MAVVKRPYGKDSPERFIDGALTGGSGPSNEIFHKSLSRKSQSINTAFGMDNVKLAMPMESSIKDANWRGSDRNLKHSLEGSSAVDADGLGLSGSAKSTVIPNH